MSSRWSTPRGFVLRLAVGRSCACPHRPEFEGGTDAQDRGVRSHLAHLGLIVVLSGASQATRLFYESAYVSGQTVTINAIEVHQGAPLQAQADFYQVVYPIGWQFLGFAAPQCNPCDHDGGGIDFIDFHDLVLDSMPSSPGHGEFSPLWARVSRAPRIHRERVPRRCCEPGIRRFDSDQV